MSDERVASTADVPLNEVRVVQCGARSLALSNVDGEFYAIDNVCTHDGGPLGEGRLRNGRVICPRHGARFCLATGAALTPPAYESIRVFAVRRHDDRIEVRSP